MTENMSLLGYPDPIINSPDMQIWNNAAFDKADLDESISLKPSFVDQFFNPFDSESYKENQTTALFKSNLSAKSPIPIKPLDPNGAAPASSKGKPLKLLFKQGLLPISSEKTIVESKVDSEIEEIEKEISRLSSRLETLRLEKESEMEQKQWLDLKSSIGQKFRKRGISLGPSEINEGIKSLQKKKVENAASVKLDRRKSCFLKMEEIDQEKGLGRRRMTMGTSEIVRFQPWGKAEKTPIRLNENRCKSQKLPEINVDKVNTQRGGRNFTLSPKSLLKSVGSKKSVKMDNVGQSSAQPKNRLSEGERSVPTNRSIRSGRVVPSRYSQIPGQSAGNQRPNDQRKRALPEDEKGDSKRCDRKNSFTECGSNQGSDSRVKKRWEIPSLAMTRKSLVDSPSQSISQRGNLLPKISTIRCKYQSPRDSGAAKRVAELIGRKSYFDAKGNSVCQALNFEEEEE